MGALSGVRGYSVGVGGLGLGSGGRYASRYVNCWWAMFGDIWQRKAVVVFPVVQSGERSITKVKKSTE